MPIAVAINAVSMFIVGKSLNATRKTTTSRTSPRENQAKKTAITFSCVRIAVNGRGRAARPRRKRPRGSGLRGSRLYGGSAFTFRAKLSSESAPARSSAARGGAPGALAISV